MYGHLCKNPDIQRGTSQALKLTYPLVGFHGIQLVLGSKASSEVVMTDFRCPLRNGCGSQCGEVERLWNLDSTDLRPLTGRPHLVTLQMGPFLILSLKAK